ncbi:Cell division protein FtsI [Lachnospiraceae bacterium TWA4]|nr:Cell division protein FtsI [Lachnospiraceae bacterium TWA4]
MHEIRSKVYQRKKLTAFILIMLGLFIGMTVRLFYLMVIEQDYYMKQAQDIQQRERAIKAARGQIYDRYGVIVASNRTVCTISVVYSQVKEPEKVIEKLSSLLELDENEVRKK